METTSPLSTVPVDAARWNAIREDGPPAWLNGMAVLPRRLEALAAAADDVQLRWLRDPAGIDRSIALPVLEMGSEGAPTLLLVAGQHGRELAPVAASVDWAEQLLTARAGGDAAAGALLATRRLVLLPAANPRGIAGALDAVRAAATGPAATRGDIDSMPGDTTDPSPFERFLWQRKNQSGPRGGVDLNRNHPATWQPTDAADVVREGRHAWQGERAASEPETRIMAAVIDRYRPSAVVDLHQYGNFTTAELGEGLDPARAAPQLAQLVAGTSLAKPRPEDTRTLRDRVPPAIAGLLEQQATRSGAQLGLTVELGDTFLPDEIAYAQLRTDVSALLTRMLVSTGSFPSDDANRLLPRGAISVQP